MHTIGWDNHTKLALREGLALAVITVLPDTCVEGLVWQAKVVQPTTIWRWAHEMAVMHAQMYSKKQWKWVVSRRHIRTCSAGKRRLRQQDESHPRVPCQTDQSKNELWRDFMRLYSDCVRDVIQTNYWLNNHAASNWRTHSYRWFDLRCGVLFRAEQLMSSVQIYQKKK